MPRRAASSRLRVCRGRWRPRRPAAPAAPRLRRARSGSRARPGRRCRPVTPKNSSRVICLPVRVAGDRAVLCHVVLQPVRVEAFGVVEVAGVIADRDERHAEVARSTAVCEPTLPKPCTISFLPSSSKRVALGPLDDAVHQALPGRLLAAERAAAGDRLAGDDALHGLLDDHADGVHVRVHRPGHDLRVGAHVGRGDVVVGADVARRARGRSGA